MPRHSKMIRCARPLNLRFDVLEDRQLLSNLGHWTQRPDPPTTSIINPKAASLPPNLPTQVLAGSIESDLPNPVLNPPLDGDMGIALDRMNSTSGRVGLTNVPTSVATSLMDAGADSGVSDQTLTEFSTIGTEPPVNGPPISSESEPDHPHDITPTVTGDATLAGSNDPVATPGTAQIVPAQASPLDQVRNGNRVAVPASFRANKVIAVGLPGMAGDPSGGGFMLVMPGDAPDGPGVVPTPASQPVAAGAANATAGPDDAVEKIMGGVGRDGRSQGLSVAEELIAAAGAGDVGVLKSKASDSDVVIPGLEVAALHSASPMIGSSGSDVVIPGLEVAALHSASPMIGSSGMSSVAIALSDGGTTVPPGLNRILVGLPVALPDDQGGPDRPITLPAPATEHVPEWLSSILSAAVLSRVTHSDSGPPFSSPPGPGNPVAVIASVQGSSLPLVVAATQSIPDDSYADQVVTRGPSAPSETNGLPAEHAGRASLSTYTPVSPVQLRGNRSGPSSNESLIDLLFPSIDQEQCGSEARDVDHPGLSRTNVSHGSPNLVAQDVPGINLLHSVPGPDAVVSTGPHPTAKAAMAARRSISPWRLTPTPEAGEFGGEPTFSSGDQLLRDLQDLLGQLRGVAEDTFGWAIGRELSGWLMLALVVSMTIEVVRRELRHGEVEPQEAVGESATNFLLAWDDP